jgi:hypothetical protein
MRRSGVRLDFDADRDAPNGGKVGRVTELLQITERSPGSPPWTSARTGAPRVT